MKSLGPNYFLIIIGAMKAGTTSLYDVLVQHPQIAPCIRKEPNFFKKDSNSRHEKPNLETYQALWPTWNSDQHTWAIEASTAYTIPSESGQMAARAGQLLSSSEVRLVYMIRHPLDRIRSHYEFGAARGWYSTAKAYESDLVLQRTCWPSRYAYHLDSWLAHFPKDSLLILRFEDFARNPKEVVGAVLHHCGLDSNWQLPTLQASNATDTVKPLHPKLRQTLNWIPGWQKLRLRERIPKNLQKWLRAQGTSKLTLSSTQRTAFLEMLKDDLERLESVHGFDLEPWDLDQEPGWNSPTSP